MYKYNVFVYLYKAGAPTRVNTGICSMPRNYPRFLFSSALNVKSPGFFIVHTIYPRMLCRALYDLVDNKLTFVGVEDLDYYDTGASEHQIKATHIAMRNWFKQTIVSTLPHPFNENRSHNG